MTLKISEQEQIDAIMSSISLADNKNIIYEGLRRIDYQTLRIVKEMINKILETEKQ